MRRMGTGGMALVAMMMAATMQFGCVDSDGGPVMVDMMDEAPGLAEMSAAAPLVELERPPSPIVDGGAPVAIPEPLPAAQDAQEGRGDSGSSALSPGVICEALSRWMPRYRRCGGEAVRGSPGDIRTRGVDLHPMLQDADPGARSGTARAPT